MKAAQEEESSGIAAAAARGKRTKRRRRHHQAEPSPSTASSESIVTEEEEDMANCLILLAGGRCAAGGGPPLREYSAAEKQRIDRGVTDSAAAAGVFECKTCNKCFASFQALGGHRASHKKPKLGRAAEKESATVGPDGANARESNISTGKPSTATYKIHECSICRSEFSSGQALGGHMRRHRPPAPETQQSGKKEITMVSHAFDLNLPPPASFDDVDDGAKRVIPSPAPYFTWAETPGPPLDVLPATPTIH